MKAGGDHVTCFWAYQVRHANISLDILDITMYATKYQLKAKHQANFRSQQGGKNNNEAKSKRNPFRNANRSNKIFCCLLSSTFFAINQILLSIGVYPRCFNSGIKWNIYRRRSIRGHSLALEELFITTRHTLQIWKIYDSLRSVNRLN